MTKTAVDLLIFDLDGTLIESKWDIAHSVNLTLVELGLPERPLEEIFGFVGDGVKKLLRLAVGESNRVSFDEALAVFRGHYMKVLTIRVHRWNPFVLYSASADGTVIRWDSRVSGSGTLPFSFLLRLSSIPSFVHLPFFYILLQIEIFISF